MIFSLGRMSMRQENAMNSLNGAHQWRRLWPCNFIAPNMDDRHIYDTSTWKVAAAAASAVAAAVATAATTTFLSFSFFLFLFHSNRFKNHHHPDSKNDWTTGWHALKFLANISLFVRNICARKPNSSIANRTNKQTKKHTRDHRPTQNERNNSKLHTFGRFNFFYLVAIFVVAMALFHNVICQIYT